jgi:hypothetical protein
MPGGDVSAEHMLWLRQGIAFTSFFEKKSAFKSYLFQLAD